MGREGEGREGEEGRWLGGGGMGDLKTWFKAEPTQTVDGRNVARFLGGCKYVEEINRKYIGNYMKLYMKLC